LDFTVYESSNQSKEKLAVMIPILKELEDEEDRLGEKTS
jgi:hypothetical protein